MQPRASAARMGDTIGDLALKGELGTTFVRRLASAVIVRAVQDLAAGDDEARSALIFLFGPTRDCSGWLGLLDISTDFIRPRVVRHYEQVRDRFPGGDAAARLRRKRSREALLRIRRYVLTGELPRPKESKRAKQSEEDGDV